MLKAKIQHIAASEAGRDLHYHPFHDTSLKDQLEMNKLRCTYVGSAYQELLNQAEQKIYVIIHESRSSKF